MLCKDPMYVEAVSRPLPRAENVVVPTLIFETVDTYWYGTEVHRTFLDQYIVR